MSDDEKHWMICLALSVSPVDPSGGSVVRWCSVCATEVWISESGMSLGETVTPICWDCAAGIPQLHDARTMIPEAIREQLREQGFSDADIDFLSHISDKLLMKERKKRELSTNQKGNQCE